MIAGNKKSMSYGVIHWTLVNILIEITNIFPNSSLPQESKWTTEAAWCSVAVDLEPAAENEGLRKWLRCTSSSKNWANKVL